MIKTTPEIAAIYKKALLDILESIRPYQELTEWHQFLYDNRKMDDLIMIKCTCESILRKMEMIEGLAETNKTAKT